MIAVMPVQFAVGISVTCAAGFLMIVSGLQKRLLERTTFGICPTCGRRLQRRVCDDCSNRT